MRMEMALESLFVCFQPPDMVGTEDGDGSWNICYFAIETTLHG
jgi:hypothetical protein